MHSSFKRFMLVVALAMAAAGVFAADQSVEGVVKDSQGGVLPGVAVALTQTDTGLTRNVLTDDEGRYIFSGIKPGNYELKAELDQFAPFKLTGVKVNVGDKLTYEIKLQVSGTTAEITVTAATEQVETNTSAVDTVIDAKRISDLPLNGRNPLDLMALAPGVAGGTFGLSTNGARGRSNNFQLDGVDNNDNTIGGALVNQNVDATEEFRLVTATPSAEYGRSGGAIVDVIVKSGTNEYHGNLFWFNRQDCFDAANWRDNALGQPKGAYRYDQYGATFGGPVIKDKLFFFFNTQFLRTHQTQTITSQTPTAAFRESITNADMRQFFDTYYPLPNSDSGANYPQYAGVYQFGAVQKQKDTQYTAKVDFAANSNHSFSARYFHNPTELTLPGTFPGPANIGVYYQQLTNKALALDWTWIISPNMVNNTKFSINKRSFVAPDNTDDELLKTRALQFNINGVVCFSGFNTGVGDPQFRDNGTYEIKDTLTWNHGNHSFKFGLDFRFAYYKGEANFGRTPILDFEPNYYSGTFAGNVRRGFVDNIPQTIYSDGQVYSADMSDYRDWRNREYDFFVQDDWKLLPNLTLNLGLRMESKPAPHEANNMYGNFNSADMVAKGYRMLHPENFFDPANYVSGYTWVDYLNTLDLSMVNWAGEGAEVVLGKQIYKSHNFNWAPRVGFSWDPWGNGKTAVRGGYAISYDRMFDNIIAWANSNAPWAYSTTLLGRNSGGTGIFPDGVNYYGHGTPVPTVSLKPELMELQGFPTIYDDNMDQPYIQTWNFGIQREIWPGNILEVSYVGSRGIHLMSRCQPIQVAYNQAFIDEAYDNGIYNYSASNSLEGYYMQIINSLNNQFNQLNYIDSNATSQYDALQASFSHRFDKGLQFQVNYTYSKAYDNGGDIVVSGTNRQGQTVFSRDYYDRDYDWGFALFDLRHNLTANFIYELPFGPGKRIGGKTEGFLAQLIGGWQINGILTYNSGVPLDYATPWDAIGSGIAGRPDVQTTAYTTEGNRTGPTQSNFVWTGVTATDMMYYGFAHPKGNYYRGTFRGPSYKNVDFSLFKEIKLPWFTQSGAKLQLRLEAFNLFNTTNYNNPNRNLRVSSGLGAMGYSYFTFANRQIQLGAKLIF